MDTTFQSAIAASDTSVSNAEVLAPTQAEKPKAMSRKERAEAEAKAAAEAALAAATPESSDTVSAPRYLLKGKVWYHSYSVEGAGQTVMRVHLDTGIRNPAAVFGAPGSSTLTIELTIFSGGLVEWFDDKLVLLQLPVDKDGGEIDDDVLIANRFLGKGVQVAAWVSAGKSRPNTDKNGVVHENPSHVVRQLMISSAPRQYVVDAQTRLMSKTATFEGLAAYLSR